jgi:hypothetical protein
MSKSKELATPLNLTRMFPECGLNSSQIGYAYFVGAVAGIKPPGNRTALIYVDSFIEFLKYREKVAKFER